MSRSTPAGFVHAYLSDRPFCCDCSSAQAIACNTQCCEVVVHEGGAAQGALRDSMGPHALPACRDLVISVDGAIDGIRQGASPRGPAQCLIHDCRRCGQIDQGALLVRLKRQALLLWQHGLAPAQVHDTNIILRAQSSEHPYAVLLLRKFESVFKQMDLWFMTSCSAAAASHLFHCVPAHRGYESMVGYMLGARIVSINKPWLKGR